MNPLIQTNKKSREMIYGNAAVANEREAKTLSIELKNNIESQQHSRMESALSMPLFAAQQESSDLLSLKTINKLTYEDLNKVNSDLLAERSSEIRCKTYGSPMRSLTEDTIPKIETMNQTLRDKVNRLETEKRDLKSKYYDTKMELEKTKAEKSVSEFRYYECSDDVDVDVPILACAVSTSYRSRDDEVELRGTGSGRKVRPHAYDGSRPVSEYARDNYKHHLKSSTYTAPLHQDYTSTTPYDYTRSSLNSSSNSDSSYGTTPYTTTTNVAKTRDHSKPFLPVSSGEIRLGKRVVVMRTCGNVGRGVVRYVGSLPNRSGSFVGVELDYPEGKHDGSFAGRQFFRCKPNRGIFVKFDKVVMCYN